tara:strand:+ start:674 stop:1858 length:1185 start_codon:yes stop_codon:yes gene_type:complete
MKKKALVIGGGIIGLSLAYKYQLKHPSHSVIVLEKEQMIGTHQSGRNSGVLHCGLYYKPNSLKAKLAVNGIRQMTKFCKDNMIEHEICGKVVVATDQKESKVLENLAKRGKINGLKGLKFLNKRDLNVREPYIKAYKSLLVPEEGIIDFKAVQNKLKEKIIEKGGSVFENEKVIGLSNTNQNIIQTIDNEYYFDILFNCSGLYSDRVFKKLTKLKPRIKIIPFRGEYFKFKNNYQGYINHLVYPVPDSKFPFLGVHFTRMIDGTREVGPNAVLAMKREGYSNFDVNIQDLFETITYKGFIKFVYNNFYFSLNEFKSSISKEKFIKKVKKMMPEVNSNMFEKGISGVRAQAIQNNGNLLMDFEIVSHNNQIHILNAPSPGATASLSIADHIINKL